MPPVSPLSSHPSRLLALAGSALLHLACVSDPAATQTADTSTSSSTASGSSTDDSSDGAETGSCFDAPEPCLRLVDCIGAIAPGQLDAVEAQFGEGGSCWCGTEPEAQECYALCVQQLEVAIDNFPTAQACHESVCSLDELDPTQPYGPAVDGACPEWSGQPQLLVDAPFGLPGSLCAPPCSGIAKFCPEHTQTSAQAVCMLDAGDAEYCLPRCYVDPRVIGGTQCPCGATCQPFGPLDSEGNERGVCTFE